MRSLLPILILLPCLSRAGGNPFTTQRVVFSADIVASACHVRIDAGNVGNNLLTFSTYRKFSGVAVPAMDFVIRLYESGATIQGCSAILAGQIATLQFGNPGQLDSSGVVTRGAGEGIRVAVKALDDQADWRGRITEGNTSVNYPADFASRGQFRFTAKPMFPADVKAGEYTGSLSFVVMYQ
ncbi:fimbrial protein [Citrobacter freundii]|nr:fimbrial protein [Citrobacter freundii]